MGEWVQNMDAPYYSNDTCETIHEYQNCMKHGRPDTEFMKWRWKPYGYGCEIPVFNSTRFLEMVRGKSMAFVGDSLARNHMQSLVCLLSQVERPLDNSTTQDENFKRWYYPSYNFTLAMIWSPFLVKAQENDPNGKPGKITFAGLYLDEVDETWAAQIDGLDHIIISAGHWFFRLLILYEKRHIMGCRYCWTPNITEQPLSYGYRNAFKTAFGTILEREKFKGKVYLRTFSPPHYEGGDWYNGGYCLRKKPMKSNEIHLEGQNLEMYKAQLEVFEEAQNLAQKRGLKFGLMDMTRIMLMRPDGHPSKYGHWENVNGTRPNDCIHWCLPGPIDSWNDILLEMLKE
ncbi:unnamed protein product [Amaranthus hypochondriacus]